MVKLRMAESCQRGAPEGGYCNQCERIVHDLRFVSSTEALGLALLHGRRRFCGRMHVGPEGNGIFPSTHTRAAALVAASLALVACTAETQASPMAASAAADDAGRRIIVQDNVGLIIFPQIRFATGSTVIPSGATSLIDAVAAVLRRHPELPQTTVEGNGDTTEPDVQSLSEERARAVIRELVARGIDASRLRAKGWADTHPVSSNGTGEGREQNRRVEFHIEEP